MTARYWEDYSVGEVFETEPVAVSEEQIIAFAEKYDPQVFHTDPVAAKGSFYGGLIASGHQTIGLAFAQFIRLGLFTENALGGPGMDEISWTAPVRPGDTLHTTAEVVELRASKSRPDRGIIRVRLATRVGDQDVSSYITTTFLSRRPAEDAT
ncbi:MAG: MaoC family dehydratase [Rhodospirillaceae bacterium]|jgi:acyl dehydratase|nr:MaoC family dehydratase [Rhodospirillaceae bacterium]MBT3931285.1 MaoC family dehydratase [Rhodospirillaceae bacterium]MBT4772100.1 MaoC family dehydratase [Rhodospirillaceae bacterium]MBT5359387.1 MaoC family dehydratase [Rhodospirillaceae bacterium]MBT5768420.1 MaoC family dehydratase [Rhodospirillaceae bacterium]